MKPKFRSNSLLMGLIALCASLHSAQAGTNQYWDTNGTDAGFGTASGTWGTDAFWNDSSNGDGSGTFSTTPAGGVADARFFGNGSTGLGAGTITVTGTVDSGAMKFASGSGDIEITGGAINLGTITDNNAYFTVRVDSALATISSDLVGETFSGSRGLRKEGNGILSLSGNNSGLLDNDGVTGSPTNIEGGVLRIDSANALPTGQLNISTGVLGLTNASGDFSRSYANNSTGVKISNAGGFAAYGGDRNVALGTSAIFSGTTNSGIQSGDTRGLTLGHATADSMVMFTTNLNIAGQQAAINAGNGSAAIDGTVSGVISDSVGTGTLYKNGTGTLALTGANTYAGATNVTAGTLLITNPYLADASDVTISLTGKLDLQFDESGGDVSDTVSTLTFGDVQQPAGIYGATGSGATTIDDDRFAGVGTLTVLNGPGGDDYSTWATTNGIDGELFEDDFDNDGISNGVEYALGLNPSTSSQPAGVLSGDTITFTKGADAIANGDVSWIIETSETLAAGSWTAEVTQAAGDATATIAYSFTLGSPTKKFARLKVVQAAP